MKKEKSKMLDEWLANREKTMLQEADKSNNLDEKDKDTNLGEVPDKNNKKSSKKKLKKDLKMKN